MGSWAGFGERGFEEGGKVGRCGNVLVIVWDGSVGVVDGRFVEVAKKVGKIFGGGQGYVGERVRDVVQVPRCWCIGFLP